MHLAPEDTCFPLDGDSQQSLMGLRLWITRRLIDHTLPSDQLQIINYVDFTPNIDTDDKSQRFRKLDQVIDRINFEFQAGVHPKIGSIITIETLYHPVTSDWKIDNKNTLKNFPSRCVSIIRIFYSKKPPGVKFNCPIYKLPSIGIEDFVPKQLSSGGFFKSPVFENFSQVLTRATDWITSNPELEFKNAQCLEVKMKTMGRIDTKIMSHNGDRGDYIRIYRVAYTKSKKYFPNRIPAAAAAASSSIDVAPLGRPQVDMKDVMVKVTLPQNKDEQVKVTEEDNKVTHEENNDLQVEKGRDEDKGGGGEEVEECSKPNEATAEQQEDFTPTQIETTTQTTDDAIGEIETKNNSLLHPHNNHHDDSTDSSNNHSIKIKFERINTDGTGETIEPEVEVTVTEEPPKYEFISSTPLTSNPPPAPIFLSSIIFTPADQDATVHEIKKKMHEWIDQASKYSYRDGPLISRPRLLSAETVEFFCKDFSEYEIKLETENTFKPNRIGTMNQFLFMAFRVYFDVGYFGNRMESRRVSTTIATPGSSSGNRSTSCSSSCTIA